MEPEKFAAKIHAEWTPEVGRAFWPLHSIPWKDC